MEAAARLANRLLDREAWARERLAAHCGRTVRITVGPVASSFRITESGLLDGEPVAAAECDLSLFVSPLSLPMLLADPARWDDAVAMTGDSALGATLRDLAQTLPWLVEQALAGAIGPVAGQRAADLGRRLLAFPEYVAGSLGEGLGSYARDEAGLIARGDEGRAFATANADLARRADALAQRIEALEVRLAASAPAGAG